MARRHRAIHYKSVHTHSIPLRAFRFYPLPKETPLNLWCDSSKVRLIQHFHQYFLMKGHHLLVPKDLPSLKLVS
jgi:hypothetical protein